MMNGFFHVPIDEKSRKFTAFVTHNGQYEFTHVRLVSQILLLFSVDKSLLR